MGADIVLGRKRKDLKLCQSLSETPRVNQRVIGAPQRAVASRVAAATAAAPISSRQEYKAICNQAYIDSTRRFIGESDFGDLSICADSSRIGGHEVMLVFAADPHRGGVAILPPQVVVCWPHGRWENDALGLRLCGRLTHLGLSSDLVRGFSGAAFWGLFRYLKSA